MLPDRLSSLPRTPEHSTALHELGHASVVKELRLGRVDAISVVRDGPIFGWTRVTSPSPVIAAAGVVFEQQIGGQGDAGDREYIYLDALQRGVNPDRALKSSTDMARPAMKRVDEDVLDLAARGLCHDKEMTGSELNVLFKKAEEEVFAPSATVFELDSPHASGRSM